MPHDPSRHPVLRRGPVHRRHNATVRFSTPERWTPERFGRLGGRPPVVGMDLPAIGTAVGAALAFAFANNLQQQAASAVPVLVGGPVRLLLRLVRSRHWLLGASVGVAGLLLQAVSLARGGVIITQSVLPAGLVAALGVEAVRERRRPRSREVAGSGLLIAGVLAVLGFGNPQGNSSVTLGVQWQSAIVLGAVAAAGLAISATRRAGRSAVLMAVAAGTCFALGAVYLKGIANGTDDLDAVPAATSLIGLIAASVIGNLLLQQAYQRAPLRMTLPAAMAADPLASVALGVLVIGEHLQGGALPIAATGLGLVGVVGGIALTTITAPAPASDPLTPRPSRT